MFDFAWTEIALIGVVALVAIGPKDLPVAIKTIAGFVKKARKMASEFQGHVDEMVREANLHEVRDEFQKLRNFDIKGEIEKAVDSDGSLRATLNENPIQDALNTLPETEVPSRVDHSFSEPSIAAPISEAPASEAPASEPPSFVPPETVAAPVPPAPPEPPAFVPPAFVPPGTHLPQA